MYIMDDGIRLSAKLEMPEKQSKKMPVVVIIHGFTGHKDEPHLLAVNKALLEAGCVTLRADMYGHGESGGAFHDHNLFKWMNNAMTLVDYARALPFAGNIYLLGHSQGGLTAILTAAMERDVIKGLMALSPALMIPEIARQGSLLGYPYDPEHLPAEIPAWNGKTLGSNYIRVAQTIHVEEAIDRYKGPVLLVHGDNDGAVPVQCSIDAAARYLNAQLCIIKGDDHCYGVHLDQVAAAVQKWIKARIREDGNNG